VKKEIGSQQFYFRWEAGSVELGRSQGEDREKYASDHRNSAKEKSTERRPITGTYEETKGAKKQHEKKKKRTGRNK